MPPSPAPPPAPPPSVAVVGARCTRQGIGGHLARFFAAEGCPLPAVAGSTESGAAAAADEVERATGRRPRPYADVGEMLFRERPAVLVIASPHETHEAYLRLALEAGVHVLCEKPLCWGGPDPVGSAEALARAFADAGLHLAVNCQWPHTLDAYRRLFPGVLERPPRSFRMLLSPRTHGARMLPDALPHALSLLHAILPDPGSRVEEVVLSQIGEDTLEVSFFYRAWGHTTEAVVLLRPCERPPRPAAYAFDGGEARRHVDLDGYRMRLEGNGRSVPLPDPTPRLVAAFVARLVAGDRARIDPAAIPGMRHLATLCEAGARA